MSQTEIDDPPKPPPRVESAAEIRKLVESALSNPETREKLTKMARVRLQSHSIFGSHAEDLVSDAIARAWQRHETYEPDRNPVIAWLYGYLNMVLLEFSRRNRRTPMTGYDDSAFEKLVAEANEQAEQADSFLQAKTCLEKLPAKTRRMFEMRAMDDCPFSEIAKRFGVTETGARQTVQRAKKELRQLLSDPRTEGRS
jgi:RNA polymerase sigma-70 factor (ECF subfamily)